MRSAGGGLWLDGIGRQELYDGTLGRLVREHGVRGVCCVPAAGGSAGRSAYAPHLAVLAWRDLSPGAALGELLAYDARWAADLLRPLHETSAGADGQVSVALDPRLAHAADASVAAARRLVRAVGRSNVLVAIPATLRGLGAVEECLAAGIGVHATNVYSVERYVRVVDSCFAGLERAARAGRDLALAAPVLSFALDGLDAAVERRLGEADGGAADAVRGRVAPASARIVCALHAQLLGSARWADLARRGARAPRLLWGTPSASPDDNGTAHRAGYGARPPGGGLDLVAWDVLRAVPAPGGARAAVGAEEGPRDEGEAWEVLAALPGLGICYRELATGLERGALARSGRRRHEARAAVAAALRERRAYQRVA
ncbi:transaldolase family protein [Streptomyces sp. NPDC058992]|uniref:transaldolase family protein n=1 Tax=Streptomyces sp. NPDC058992 TaxID=3346688 RepID=UPI0036AF16BF